MDKTFTYTKSKLLNSILSSSFSYIILMFLAIYIPKIITLKYFANKAKFYKKNMDKYDCLSLKEQDKIGYTFVKNIIQNLNFYLFPFYKKILPWHKNDTWCNRLDLTIFTKIYLILIGAASSLILIKISSNLTINSIIGKSIYSEVQIAPYESKVEKPTVSNASVMFNNIKIFLFYVFLISIPILYIYIGLGLNLCNLVDMGDLYSMVPSTDILKVKIKKYVKIVLCFVFSYLFLFGPLIYIIISLFGENISLEYGCKKILFNYFLDQDYDYVESIYRNKKSLFTNFGLWIAIFIILLVIETNIILDIKKMRKINTYVLLFIVIIVYFFILYVSFKNYNFKDEQKVFDKNNNLTTPMYKRSVNNLLQAIVKYNYSCMPFTE